MSIIVNFTGPPYSFQHLLPIKIFLYPSIVILKEAVQEFKGQRIISVTGNSKQNIQRLVGENIIDFKS